MSGPTPTTYLEDVDPAHKKSNKGKEASESAPASRPAPSSAPAGVGSSSGKHQRTLDGFFAVKSAKGGDGDERASKRIKMAKEATPAASSSAPNLELQPLNSIPFSLSSFQESLTEEQRRLLKLECEVMGRAWLKLLKDEITKPYFIALKQFLWSEGVRGVDDTPSSVKVYPPPRNIYAWSDTPLGKVKVVIVGQDPYHGSGQAHGLCFSVPNGVGVPPSLRNIYAELKAEYPDFIPPKHGNLSSWAMNGVLMLNTCLTVRAGSPGSHSNKGWEDFTDKVVDVVDKYGGANLTDVNGNNGVGRGVVFLAWGAWAAKRVAKLDKAKHLILKSAHPSPFSANKGFLGNGHFKKANEWLQKKYGPEAKVDWCNLEA
ncbi:hypothetical protein AX16_002364 [Volvariella volvacea WC 439]|nr:hypothetical protein AX16_002364 [Volvariella volvacea WC 439]